MNNYVKNRLEEIKSNPPKLSIDNIFNTSISIYKNIIGYSILTFLIYLLLFSITTFLMSFINIGNQIDYEELIYIASNYEYNEILEYVRDINSNQSINSIILSNLINIVQSSLLAPILLSIVKVAYDYDKNKGIDYSSMFSLYKSPYFLQIFIISFVSGILSIIGGLMCFFPILLFYLLLLLAQPLVIFGNVKSFDAIKISVELAFKNFGTFLLVLLIIIAAFIIGFLLCCIGLIITLPFIYVLIYALYKELIGFPKEDIEEVEFDEDIYKDNPYIR